MNENENYVDNLNGRREFFNRNFPKINREETDRNSSDILKNTCPVCGYLTLDERENFEICGICSWEDDGVDDFNKNVNSGPNHLTLEEGRKIFQKAKQKLFTENFSENDFINNLKDEFLKLDKLIEKTELEKTEIIKVHEEIINLMQKKKIYGLEKLYDK